MATIWLSRDYFNKRSVVDSNVEYSKIEVLIPLVQRKYIKRKLGADLYNAMETHILAYINSATPIPTNYKHLLDEFIHPAMVYYILVDHSTTAKYRYNNKGVQVKNSENSQSAPDEGLDRCIELWKENAEVLIEDMIRYMDVNPTFYPERFTNTSLDVLPELEGYDTDVFLGESQNRIRFNGQGNRFFHE